LGEKRFGDLAWGSGDQDGIIGGILLPPPTAIAVLESYIPKLKILKAAPGSLLERIDALNGMNAFRELSEDGRLIA
jgi:hypothetical protein